MEQYCKRQEECLTVYVPKELDHHIAEMIRTEADVLIDAYRIKKLIFDFSRTEFMDSSGIGVIIGRSRKMNFLCGEVTARNLNDRVKKIFHMSGLHKMIRLEEA